MKYTKLSKNPWPWALIKLPIQASQDRKYDQSHKILYDQGKKSFKIFKNPWSLAMILLFITFRTENKINCKILYDQSSTTTIFHDLLAVKNNIIKSTCRRHPCPKVNVHPAIQL